MGGNKSLKGRSRDGSEPPDDKWAFKFAGPIRADECLLDLHVAHPNALGSSTRIDASLAVTLTLLFDTGATCSCIRPDIAKHLNLPVMGTERVSGVNSSKLCDQVAVLFVLSQDKRMSVKFVPMIVADIDVPMILGMSEIRLGTFVVDGPNDRWRWALPGTVNRKTGA